MAGLKKKKPVGVIGAGSWGTVLARLLAENGCPVQLWCYEEEVARQITGAAGEPGFFTGRSSPGNDRTGHRPGRAIQQKELLLFVVPSHVFRDVLHR